MISAQTTRQHLLLGTVTYKIEATPHGSGAISGVSLRVETDDIHGVTTVNMVHVYYNTPSIGFSTHCVNRRGDNDLYRHAGNKWSREWNTGSSTRRRSLEAVNLFDPHREALAALIFELEALRSVQTVDALIPLAERFADIMHRDAP